MDYTNASALSQVAALEAIIGTTANRAVGAFNFQDMGMSLDALTLSEGTIFTNPRGPLPRMTKSNYRYFLTRAHERAHYYQCASTSLSLTRVMAHNNRRELVTAALSELDPGQEIFFPMRSWARDPDCPAGLAKAIELHDQAILQELVFDGSQDDALRSMWPAYPMPNIEDGLNIGMRALAESSAKAAEWLYAIRANPAMEFAADSDISSSPALYKDPLTLLIRRIPGLRLPEYLQLLVVLADFALNPILIEKTFPFPWVRNAESEPPEEMMPAERFRRLLRVAGGLTGTVNFLNKQDTFAAVSERVVNDLGWSSTEQVARRTIELMEEIAIADFLERQASVVAADSGASSEDNLQTWFFEETAKGYSRIMIAQELRLLDPTCLIAPVNTNLINATSFAFRGFAGSGISPLDDKECVVAVISWYQDRMLEMLLSHSTLSCPGRGSTAYSYEMHRIEHCPMNRPPACGASAGPDSRDELLACPLYAGFQTQLGGEWESRARPYPDPPGIGTGENGPGR